MHCVNDFLSASSSYDVVVNKLRRKSYQHCLFWHDNFDLVLFGLVNILSLMWRHFGMFSGIHMMTKTSRSSTSSNTSSAVKLTPTVKVVSTVKNQSYVDTSSSWIIFYLLQNWTLSLNIFFFFDLSKKNFFWENRKMPWKKIESVRWLNW